MRRRHMIPDAVCLKLNSDLTKELQALINGEPSLQPPKQPIFNLSYYFNKINLFPHSPFLKYYNHVQIPSSVKLHTCPLIYISLLM